MSSISFEKHTLSNGLDLILHEDHSLPVVAVNIWYHVGSKNEEPGKTGFAHLFEHVMFEGSKHNSEGHFEPLLKVGANLNGSTSADHTNYWENVPSNYLELALWLEADRMGFLLEALDQTRFDVQRDVVKNERRQSYENRPYGLARMLIQPAVFPLPHPYNWMTIGSQEDLDVASLDDVKAFFSRYYSPSNASLALAGDIEPARAVDLVEKYFGGLPPGPQVQRVGRMDSDLRGRVHLSTTDRVQLPRLYMVWPSVPEFDADEPALDTLGVILGDGKSSRLHRSLVYEKQIARDVVVHNYAQEIAGEFIVQVTAAPGHSLEEIEEELERELADMRSAPPTDEEVQRAKNRIESHHVAQMESVGGFGGKADMLNLFNMYLGDPGAINRDFDRYKAVEPSDVQRAASTMGDNMVRLSVVPEKGHAASSTSVDRTVVPAASARPAFTPPVPARSRLTNGLDLLVISRPGLPVISTGVFLRGGVLTDPGDRPGLDHFTMTMLPEGAGNRSSQDIASRMEFLGTKLSVNSSLEFASLAAGTLTSRWEDMLEVLADVVRSPTFPGHELERVRKERLTDLRRISDDPSAIARRAARALLYGPNSPNGHPASGTTDSVSAFSRDDVVNHFASRYGPSEATLILAGDVSPDEAIEKAERYFGEWTKSVAPVGGGLAEDGGVERRETTIYLADKPGAAQSVLYTGFVTLPRSHPDYYAFVLLNDVYGGQYSARLNLNLRQDKGYSYGFMSSIDWRTGPSAFLAGGAVQTAVTKESVEEVLREFADIVNDRPVTEEEFIASRDGLIRGFPSGFESRRQLMSQLSRLVLFGLPDDYFSGFVGRLEAVTLDAVQAAALKHLAPEGLMVLVVGDREVIEPGLKEIGLPVVHVDHEGRRTE